MKSISVSPLNHEEWSRFIHCALMLKLYANPPSTWSLHLLVSLAQEAGGRVCWESFRTNFRRFHQDLIWPMAKSCPIPAVLGEVQRPEATSNKGIATSNKEKTTSSKKLLVEKHTVSPTMDDVRSGQTGVRSRQAEYGCWVRGSQVDMPCLRVNKEYHIKCLGRL